MYLGLTMMLEERGGGMLRVCLKGRLHMIFDHLEELEKQRKDQKVCDDGPDSPSSGQVGIIYHVDPILQPGLELEISPNCLIFIFSSFPALQGCYE